MLKHTTESPAAAVKTQSAARLLGTPPATPHPRLVVPGSVGRAGGLEGAFLTSCHEHWCRDHTLRQPALAQALEWWWIYDSCPQLPLPESETGSPCRVSALYFFLAALGLHLCAWTSLVVTSG